MPNYKAVDADQLDQDLTAVAEAIRYKGGTFDQLHFPGDFVTAVGTIQTGVELNFEVVVNPQPTNPKENTIWVNTDAQIPKYYFSAAQPENMAEGEVWFSVDTSSDWEFNALKKDSLQIYPISAQQKVGGALSKVSVKIYQNGEWVDLVTYLYNKGDKCTEITGGWEFSTCTSDTGYTMGTYQDRTSHISLTTSQTGSSGCSTTKKIDLINVTSISVNFTELTSGRAFICVSSSRYYQDGIASLTLTNTGVATLRPAEGGSFDGSYYVLIYNRTNGSGDYTGTATFSRVWMEY